MYPSESARADPGRPCFIMAATGQVVSYAELDARANRLAHLFRAWGLERGGHYAIFMENSSRYVEACAAGERAGLYSTSINCYLTAAELAYILRDSESELLITSRAKRDVAVEAMRQASRVQVCLIVDGIEDNGLSRDLDRATACFPSTPIPDECAGTAMLYSSGTTGRPKGILRVLPQGPPDQVAPVLTVLNRLGRYRERMVYLCPAPLYHAAPQAAVGLTLRNGGTAVIMERFNAEQFLALVERHRITHSQLVPTMFSRMLKLPEDVRRRYDLSSLEFITHAGAPCPLQVKEQMIEWWGPIIHEYYGSTEGNGLTACDSREWLAHRGTVGRPILGELHILDDELRPCPSGTSGTVWFRSETRFEYFKDPESTKAAYSHDGTLSTVGDIGYVDDEGFLYLTDRAAFTIISGGVNIYPQECENLLITHPKVADAAVFGVPNADLGEEVKAVVQLMPGIASGADVEQELIAFCQEHLARQKCPRSIDFEAALPRLPTGKLYKRLLRDRYWGHAKNQIIC